MNTLYDKNVFVRVKSGKYDVDEEYTIGTVNEDSEHGKISFAPDNNTEISFSENVRIDIPELEDFHNEALKESFLNDIKENYISGYNAKPLEVGKINFNSEEEGNIILSLWLSNSGRVNANVCMLSAVYDENGKLVDMGIQNKIVGRGERSEVKSHIKLEEKYDNYTVKTYLWQDLETMIPIFNMQLVSDLKINVKNSNIYDVKTSLCDETIDLNLKAEAGSYISLKMTNESGKIIYMNQICADADGNVSYSINPQYMPAGVATLHIQSNGGGSND